MFVTGGATGIGAAFVGAFAEQGARIAFIDIDDDAGAELARRVAGAWFRRCDVRDPLALETAIQDAAEALGPITVLVNNVANDSRHVAVDTTIQGWREGLAVNLDPVFIAACAVQPMMALAGGGSIINHASVDASLGNPTIAAYSAAKGGLLPLTHVMAHDLAKYGIRVNAMSTGNITTALSGPGQGGAISARTAVTPLARTGRPEEAAHVALFFASDWSSFVNGANLVVDGGRTGITQGCFDR